MSVHDATRDLDRIGEWGRYWPAEGDGSQILGATGYRFGALDDDPAEGSEQTIWELARHGFTLPATRTTSTPHDGRHLIYLAPEGIRGGKLGPGLTLRGLGGYVLLAPSMVDGKLYTIEDDRPPVALPGWVPEWLASHSPRLLEALELEPEPTNNIPVAIERFLDQGPRAHDVSGQVLWFVSNCLEWGMTAGQALWLTVGWYQPAKVRYGADVDREVRRILAKLAPRHQHPGVPCDHAGCPATPRWMGGGGRP